MQTFSPWCPTPPPSSRCPALASWAGNGFYPQTLQLNAHGETHNDAVTFEPWALAVCGDYLGERQGVQGPCRLALVHAAWLHGPACPLARQSCSRPLRACCIIGKLPFFSFAPRCLFIVSGAPAARRRAFSAVVLRAQRLR